MEPDLFIITNNGEKFILAMHSAVHPGAYVALCEFMEPSEYTLVDQIRFVLNKFFASTATSKELQAELFEEWQPYDENWKIAKENLKKLEKEPHTVELGQYL